MHCVIAIPTYQRAAPVRRAVAAALDQTRDDLTVLVVDDGSTDDTMAALRPFIEDPRFVYLQLDRNVGTARAKNVALALMPFDALTFHDSDDIPHPTKLLRQARILALPAVDADPCLNWRLVRRVPGERLDVGAVLTQHLQIAADGQQHRVGRALSLLDDFFPNLQMAAGPPGDWILVNSGLFRRSVFGRHGGFADSVEEDRDFRNRLVMAGEVIWLIEEPLLTKIEGMDSLTHADATGFRSERRRIDREAVWARLRAWQASGAVPPEPIDLADIGIGFVSRPERLVCATDIPMTDATRVHLARLLSAGTARAA